MSIVSIRILLLLFFLSGINAQIALPTFQGVHKPHTAEASSLYDFTTHTFTNCGATGREGLTLANCTSTYSDSWTDNTSYFNVPSDAGIQYWTVPEDGTYRIEAWGARGGKGTTNGSVYGGSGARMRGDFDLSQGDVIRIIVGQQADGISRGSSNAGGGGGGGSFVIKSPYNSNGSILVIAGGGGGTGANQGVVNGNTHGQIGENGGIASANSNESEDGEGGYSGYDGAGGGGFFENGTNSETVGLGGVSFVNGGAGGDYAIGCSYPCGAHMGYGGFGGGGGVGHAGGGGGGYSGGNGTGRWGNGSWSGGGGSYNSGSNTSNSAGVWATNGKVVITKN